MTVMRAATEAAMPDTTRTDYQRRKQMHLLLIDHLSTLDWNLVTENLPRIRSSIQGDMVIAAWQRWRELIETRDLAGIATVCRADTDELDLMRSISPFAGVLSEEERLSVIRAVPR